MKVEIDRSRKMEDIKNEDFTTIQPYMSIRSVEVGRMAFKVRCKMLLDIPANCKGKFKNDEEGLICKYCDERCVMDQAHCLECVKWEHLRGDLDVTNIEDLVQFFKKMLKEKEKIDSKLKKGSNGGTAQHDS